MCGVVRWQLSSWPNLDNGAIPATRYAQTKALALPKTGMVVAADQACGFPALDSQALVGRGAV